MTTIDRSKWFHGPWDNEPDRTTWTDAGTGVVCVAIRQDTGYWCGYIGVDKNHPWFGNRELDEKPEVRVHGGVTYARAGNQAVPGRNVLYKSQDFWWIGFDCAHSGDISPAYFTKDASDLAIWDGYRDLPYVREQCAKLARQSVDLPEKWEFEVSAEESNAPKIVPPLRVEQTESSWDVVDANCMCVAECSYREHAEAIVEAMNAGSPK